MLESERMDAKTREAYEATAAHFGIEPFQVGRRHIREARRAGVHSVSDRHMEGRKVGMINGPRPSPLDPIPEGYAVHRITTTPRGQSIQARPAPDEDSTGALIPDGHIEAGRSTLIDTAGTIVQQWVKTRVAPAEAITWERLVKDFDGLIPAADPVPAPEGDLTDQILAVYPLGDPHLGLRNTNGYGLHEGAALLMAAVSDLVVRGPDAKECLIVNLGDYFHSDDPSNKTRKSGNPLDVEGDWFEILKVGRDVFIHMIQVALIKHEIVNVRILIGNHDDLSSLFLTLLIESHFRHDPRVRVDTKGTAFQWFEWGQNLIGMTHGQACKTERLAGKMASAQREAWGRTIHRYWYVGHVHHTRKVERDGVVIESFRTLAEPDAWHEAGGYLSGRDLTRIVLHREHGEVSRETVSPGMLT